MPISKQDFQGHSEVAVITFGTGDIYITKAMEANKVDNNLICFSEISGHKVGDETNTYEGKFLSELPNLHVVMRFDRPESITALIHSLAELQKSVFANIKAGL